MTEPPSPHQILNSPSDHKLLITVDYLPASSQFRFAIRPSPWCGFKTIPRSTWRIIILVMTDAVKRQNEDGKARAEMTPEERREMNSVEVGQWKIEREGVAISLAELRDEAARQRTVEEEMIQHYAAMKERAEADAAQEQRYE